MFTIAEIALYNRPSTDMQGDAAASKTAHDRQNGPNAAHEPEKHGSGSICGWTPSDYVKSIVFGGLDGIVSVFALVASVNGSSLPLEVLLLTGFAKLLGDAISMGCGDALSEQAEHSFIRGEHKRETWEMENVSLRAITCESGALFLRCRGREMSRIRTWHRTCPPQLLPSCSTPRARSLR